MKKLQAEQLMRKTILGLALLALLCSSHGPANAAWPSRQSPATTPPPWTPITGNEHNMIALGPVYRNGAQIAESHYWVASYGPGGINADCRSVGRIGDPAWGLSPGTFYATIRGNTNGDTLRFKIWDGNAAQAFDAVESLTFQADGLQNPFPLHFTQHLVYLPLVMR